MEQAIRTEPRYLEPLSVAALVDNIDVQNNRSNSKTNKNLSGMESSSKFSFLPLIGVAIGFLAVTLGPDLFTNVNESLIMDTQSSASSIMSSIDGLPFPNDIKIAGSKQSLIGGGTRSKWGFRVYAVGFYGDNKLTKSLTKKYSSENIAASTEEFTESKLARTVLLRFHREVAADKVSEALGEALVDNLGQETSNEFSNFILSTIGGDKMQKGSELFITCKGEKLWASLSEGGNADTIGIKGLCSAIFKVYLGDKPVSPQAKEGFEKGFADLVASS